MQLYIECETQLLHFWGEGAHSVDCNSLVIKQKLTISNLVLQWTFCATFEVAEKTLW
jgi:hypothetical protein